MNFGILRTFRGQVIFRLLFNELENLLNALFFCHFEPICSSVIIRYPIKQHYPAKWSGSTNFDECGSKSGSNPDPGQKNHQIDFKPSFKSQENNIFKSLPKH